jgi:hypothetical protein
VTRRIPALVTTMALLLTFLQWSLLVSPASALKCGVWRWPVKTLLDTEASQVDYTPKASSVRRLRTLDPPSSLSADTPRIERPFRWSRPESGAPAHHQQSRRPIRSGDPWARSSPTAKPSGK